MTVNQNDFFADITEPVISILGPTASGKTALACQIYDSNPDGYNIISVDSALVYKDMNIGTAKPTETELKQYPHALVNIIDPTQVYSAAQFALDARGLIKNSHQSGKVPILVGGTMLYFKALFGGFDDIPASEPEIREQLNQELKDVGLNKLYLKLKEIDAPTAQRLNPTDTQRILRALEVYEVSGKPISSFQTGQQKQLPNSWRIFGIYPDRAVLHGRIEQRLQQMWQQGFEEEVLMLIKKYNLTQDHNSMRSVGYRQALEFILNTKQTNGDRQTMKNKALFATRQLAKRQLTWYRKFEKSYKIETFQSHEVNITNLI